MILDFVFLASIRKGYKEQDLGAMKV